MSKLSAALTGQIAVHCGQAAQAGIEVSVAAAQYALVAALHRWLSYQHLDVLPAMLRSGFWMLLLQSLEDELNAEWYKDHRHTPADVDTMIRKVLEAAIMSIDQAALQHNKVGG